MIDRWKAQKRTNTFIWSPNDDDSRLGIELVEADGADELARGLSTGDAGDPFPGTATSRSYSKATRPRSYSQRSLYHIHEAGLVVRLEFVPEYTCP